MINVARPSRFSEQQLLWLCGVSVEQFAELVAELGPLWEADRYAELSARQRQRAVGAGRRHGLPFTSRLFVCLVYLRWDLSFRALGALVGFSKDTVHRAVNECTPLLAAKGITRPDGTTVTNIDSLADALAAVDHQVIADGTFVPIPRPGGGWAAQKSKFSGHRHRHCHTTQVICDTSGHLLWVTGDEPGPTHDQTALVTSKIPEMIRDGAGTLVADRAYRGIAGHVEGLEVLVPISGVPHGQSAYNKAHAVLRVQVEHRIRDLKRRKILHDFRRNPDRLTDTLRAIAALATLPKPATAM